MQFYAENPSTDSQTFILEFSSGDRLHMSLKKRAVLSAGAQVVENFHNRRETSFLEARDCVFSGHVGEIQRGDLASLSVCDGNLVRTYFCRSFIYTLTLSVPGIKCALFVIFLQGFATQKHTALNQLI